MWYIYAVVYYSAIKKNEMMPFSATRMQLEIIILSEVKSERERQIPYDTTYMWNLKYGTNELIYETNRTMDIENRLVVAKGEGAGGGMEWEVGVSRYKLLYIEWISKVLLYSTGNYIQYPMIKP